jgi:hypothetical protein
MNYVQMNAEVIGRKKLVDYVDSSDVPQFLPLSYIIYPSEDEDSGFL